MGGTTDPKTNVKKLFLVGRDRGVKGEENSSRLHIGERTERKQKIKRLIKIKERQVCHTAALKTRRG